MNNKAKLIPILLLCPVLFMANSPAPESYDPVIDYSDFEVTTREYVEAENETYRLAVDVTNTGDKYMIVDNAFSAFILRDEILFRKEGLSSYIFHSDLIAPHQTAHLVSCDKVQTSFSLEMYAFTAEAIDNERAIMPKYSGIKLEQKDIFSEYTSYCFELQGLVYSQEYYYAAIYDFNIKGENHCFNSYYFDSWINVYLKSSHYVEEDFVLNRIYIIPTGSRLISNVDETWSVVWNGIGIAIIAGFFISPAFIPLIIKSAKKKRRKEQEKTLS